jgi:DNA polymerase
VHLYPLYHPAAALYTPSTLEMLRADFLRIPEILSLGPPPQPKPEAELEHELQRPQTQPTQPAHRERRTAPVEPPESPASVGPAPAASDQQLGLF